MAIPNLNQKQEIEFRLYDWNFDSLFDEKFWMNVDLFILNLEPEIQKANSETNFIKSSFGQGVNKRKSVKLSEEFNKFLWNLTDNKIKYFFDFDIKIFSIWLGIISEEEFFYFKKLIFGFQTEIFIKSLLNNQFYSLVRNQLA